MTIKDRELRMRRLMIEAGENWDQYWDLPFFTPKAGWQIQVIPPMAGAIVRFKVRKGPAEVSVYFDPFCRIGGHEDPYWEMYPSAGDDAVDRFLHADFEQLIEAIDKSLNRQIVARYEVAA